MPNIIKVGGGGSYGTLAAQITNFYATIENASVVLTWAVPADTNFVGVAIVRKTGSYPTKVSDGTKIYEGTALTFTDTGLTNGTQYYYRAFTYNAKKEYQTQYCTASGTPLEGNLLSSMPVGTKVKDPLSTYYGQSIPWEIADKNHTGYPANSATLITDKSIAFKCTDGKEPANTDTQRASLGNNRYLYANMRQWLNSAASGTWYVSQHSADAPPSTANTTANSYDTQSGFQNAFSSKFKAMLLTTTLIVAKNTSTDGGGSETFSDKVFFASNTEVGIANVNSIAEGAKLSIFSDAASRTATPTAEAVSNGGTGTVGVANLWGLRTPYVASSWRYESIDLYGNESHNDANLGVVGVRPLCNIPLSTLVSLTPDANGYYSIL